MGVMTNEPQEEPQEEPQPTPGKPERTPQPKLAPLENPPPDVSNPCLIGRHTRCTGKVALQQLRHGRRYVKCRCPVCKHPEIRRSMPLKD